MLEKANKVGKKILMSGGGRCNFTNYFVGAENFISSNPHFCKSALQRYTQWDFIALVEKHGIAYEERKHGQLFCRDSAREILDMLLHECEQGGVEIRTHCELNQIASESEPCHTRFRLVLAGADQGSELTCESLVIATGALSIPTLGGSGEGYNVAQQFGIRVTDRRAGLVPFIFSDHIKPLCERLSGVSTQAEITCNDKSFTEDLLFTHRGMSGPVVLQISNYWHPGDLISIDLLPDCDAAQWLLEAKTTRGKTRVGSLLNEKLPRALVQELQALWWPQHGQRAVAELTDRQLSELGEKLNAWHLKPAGTEGYRTAEVTLGGVDTADISSKTMEAIGQTGLHFIGEVLDVTGHLGGFNFQWAWSSGYAAGQQI